MDTQNDDVESFALADDLPEFDVAAFEQLRADNPRVSGWLVALEFEDEGDIPSEITPVRRLSPDASEGISAIPETPLREGGVFEVEVLNHVRRTKHERAYRVLGRMRDGKNDWVVVERLTPAAMRWAWELSEDGAHRDHGELAALSSTRALERATQVAFGGVDVGPPREQDETSRRWTLAGRSTVLEVRPLPAPVLREAS